MGLQVVAWTKMCDCGKLKLNGHDETALSAAGSADRRRQIIHPQWKMRQAIKHLSGVAHPSTQIMIEEASGGEKKKERSCERNDTCTVWVSW